MEGYQDTPYLEIRELWAIFRVERDGGSWGDAREAAYGVSGRKRNQKTIRGAVSVAREFRAIGVEQCRALDDTQATAIATKVGYSVSTAKVQRLRTEFILWAEQHAGSGATEAKQRAIVGHQDDLVRMASSLLYNIRVPKPRDALYDMFASGTPSRDRTQALLNEAEAVMHAWSPGPKIGFVDGEIYVTFLPEDYPLFPGLMEHVQESGLETVFRQFKRVIIEFVERCWRLKDAVAESDMQSDPEIERLTEEARELAQKLVDGLTQITLRREISGRCRFCPE